MVYWINIESILNQYWINIESILNHIRIPLGNKTQSFGNLGNGLNRFNSVRTNGWSITTFARVIGELVVWRLVQWHRTHNTLFCFSFIYIMFVVFFILYYIYIPHLRAQFYFGFWTSQSRPALITRRWPQKFPPSGINSFSLFGLWRFMS